MSRATLARTVLADWPTVMVGPGSWLGRIIQYSGGERVIDDSCAAASMPPPCSRSMVAVWLMRTGAPGRPAISSSTGARAPARAGRYTAYAGCRQIGIEVWLHSGVYGTGR